GHVELEGAQATLRTCDRRLLARPRDAMIVTVGEIRNPQLSESVLTFQIINVVGMLESVQIPRRLFQSHCNVPFGSQACGVDLSASPNTISTTVQAGSDEESIVVSSSVLTNAGSLDPGDFWANGYIVAAGGPAVLQARPIHRI